MRLSILLMLVFTLHLSATGFGQISFEAKNMPIRDVFEILEKETGCRFFYNDDLIFVDKTVNMKVSDRNIDQVLNRLFESTGLSYKKLENDLVVVAPKKDLQQNVVTGRVTDASTGQAMPGVNIQVKGTTLGVISGIDGGFSLTVPDLNASLVFSFIGYVTQEVALEGRIRLDIVLSEDLARLDEVVVVGYGTQKAATITGAISAVKAENLKATSTINFTNTFAGRLPGLVVVTRSGEPGNDNSTMRIRGLNTLGDNSPLIVIDGIANRSMQRLNPGDIESITVLKDASAAIYGAQAANGVILITTKRGTQGKPQINITANQGWAMPTVIPKMCDASTYATLLNEIDVYAGKSPRYTQEQIDKYASGTDPWAYPNTDWFDATFKTAASQQAGNMSVSGGTENMKYFVSLGGNYQDAIYRNSATKYSQVTFRSNIDGRISKNINLSFDVSGRQENRNYPTRSAGSIFAMLMRGYPTSVAYWPTGENGPDIEYGNNPVVVTTNQTGYDRTKRYVFESLLKLNITIPWIQGLSFTGNASVDKSIESNKLWEKPWYLYSWDGVSYDANEQPVLLKGKKGFSTPQLTQRFSDGRLITLNALLNYERTFNEVHDFRFLAGTERIAGESMEFEAFRKYFASTAIDELFAGGDSEKNNTGSASISARLNYFGRVNYAFKQKYLAEFVWRYDGSYIFPQEKRFGFFPGVSVGWRISEEEFWKNNLALFNYFKLRGSWGQTGNDRIDTYQYLSSYGYNSSANGVYTFNNSVENKILSELRIPNPNVTWEVANQSNIGFDAEMLKGRLNFSAEYFYNLRTNILTYRNASVPASTGLTLPRENIGKVVNQGFEFTIGYNNAWGALTYDISVNSGYQKNRIKFWDETPGIPDYQKSTGHPMNSTLYYQAIGVFKDQAEVDAYPHWAGARPGDIIFEDVNDDKKIDGLDRKMNYKTDMPTFTGGMNINLGYRNFYTSIFLQWAAGAVVNRYYEMQGEAGNFLLSDVTGRWTESNQVTNKPRTWNRYGEYWRDNENNTYWLSSTDYLRLKNFEIGYSFSESIKNIGISDLRIYFSGINLLTLDKLTDFDPESTSATAYPLNKVFNIGLNVIF